MVQHFWLHCLSAGNLDLVAKWWDVVIRVELEFTFFWWHTWARMQCLDAFYFHQLFCSAKSCVFHDILIANVGFLQAKHGACTVGDVLSCKHQTFLRIICALTWGPAGDDVQCALQCPLGGGGAEWKAREFATAILTIQLSVKCDI